MNKPPLPTEHLKSAWTSIGPNVWRNLETMHKVCVTEISQHKLFSAFSPNNYYLGTFEDRDRALYMCRVCNQETIEWLIEYQSTER